jgi:hypothetical protein
MLKTEETRSLDVHTVTAVAIKFSNFLYVNADAVIKVLTFLNFLYFNNSEYKLSTFEYNVFKQKKVRQLNV